MANAPIRGHQARTCCLGGLEGDSRATFGKAEYPHRVLWQIPGARVIELRPGHVQRTIAQWQSLVGGNFSL